MPINIPNNNRCEELLDSDDELPMEYNDIATTPAYQIDSRFDMIQFKWINNAKTFDSPKTCSKETSSICTTTTISSPSEIDYPITSNSNNYNQTPVVQRGVLHKHDLFCLKSIEGHTDDSTFIWLVNFLLRKDLQSDYEFLKSCLVGNTLIKKNVDYKYVSPSETKHRYNIVIKM